MEWTRRHPTQTGWYWWRDAEGGRPEAVEVIYDSSGLGMRIDGRPGTEGLHGVFLLPCDAKGGESGDAL